FLDDAHDAVGQGLAALDEPAADDDAIRVDRVRHLAAQASNRARLPVEDRLAQFIPLRRQPADGVSTLLPSLLFGGTGDLVERMVAILLLRQGDPQDLSEGRHRGIGFGAVGLPAAALRLPAFDERRMDNLQMPQLSAHAARTPQEATMDDNPAAQAGAWR